MSDELNSQLSAFVDDELTPEESELFVRRLCRDETLRRTATSYGLIGDAIRGDTAITAPSDFVAGVMMAVEGQAVPAARVRPDESRHSMRNWGFALAASVVLAAVALVTLPGSGPDSPDTVVAGSDTGTDLGTTLVADTASSAPVFVTSPQPTRILPGDGNVSGLVQVGVNAQNVPIVMPVSAERRAQLNNLLLQHLNSSGASRQPGLVGFRNVGFVTQTESPR